MELGSGANTSIRAYKRKASWNEIKPEQLLWYFSPSASNIVEKLRVYKLSSTAEGSLPTS